MISRKLSRTIAVARSLILPAVFCLILCSCGGKLEESSHPLYKKAKDLVERKSYSEAAQAFKEYLQINPNSPAAHYELAVLYDDVLSDPLLAIYHYRTYLELVPDSQDRENARMWLEQAEKKYFDRNHDRFSDDTDALKRLEAALAKEKKYVAAIEKLLKENKHLRMKISPGAQEESQAPGAGTEAAAYRPEQAGGAQNPQSVDLTPGPVVSDPQPGQPAQKRENLPRKYQVQTGDTPMKISKKFYGDTKYYKLIMDANKDRVSSPSDLKIGEEITIPPLN